MLGSENGVDTFPDPVGHFGPIAAILDFAGGAAVQAVSFVSKKMKMPAKLVEV